MEDFQSILSEAAKLKESQLKKERKGYESLPEFLKSGLAYYKKYSVIRNQNFLFQFRISNKIKERGNNLFKCEKYEEAQCQYEEALGIFRYISSKSYENMKDEDMTYFKFDESQLSPFQKEKYQTHLCALYLNICSCLTKTNKKDDAVFSADEALKVKRTAKGHYKKAQAYLKYINRDINDIKLGILELKQAYEIEKDDQILKEMHSVKQKYEEEMQKSQKWFKGMLSSNSN